MKKIQIIITFLFSFIAESHAGIYSDNYESGSSGQYGALYGNSQKAISGSSSSGGLFRTDPAPDLGARPDTGISIAQDAPIGDGLYILIAVCIIWGIIKFIKERHAYKKCLLSLKLNHNLPNYKKRHKIIIPANNKSFPCNK